MKTLSRSLVLALLATATRAEAQSAPPASTHRFCHAEQGKDECGVFSFVHIWRRTTTGWKISRVISYGH
jgi:hypothetical protein